MRLVLLLAFVAATIAACTLWVDNQFKGYSGTCQLPNANANVCGQCGTQHCQQFIDKTCGESITFDTDRCFGDPSYSGSDWQCQWLLDDAAVTDPTQTQDDSNLRHCVHDNCLNECTTCTDFEAGAGDCGDCLRTMCSQLLNGVPHACCADESINQGMVACRSSVNHDCSAFLNYDDGGAPMPDASDPDYCMRAFSNCVQHSCAPRCKD